MSLRCKRWIQTWHFRVCLRLQDFFPSNSLLNRDSGRLPDDIYWGKHDAPNLPRPCLWNLSLTESTLYTPPDAVEFLRKMDEKEPGRCCLCGSCCLLQNQNDTCWKLAITPISLKSGKPSNLRWSSEFVWFCVHVYFQHSPRCYTSPTCKSQNSSKTATQTAAAPRDPKFRCPCIMCSCNASSAKDLELSDNNAFGGNRTRCGGRGKTWGRNDTEFIRGETIMWGKHEKKHHQTKVKK